MPDERVPAREVLDPEAAADTADAGLVRGVRRNLVLWSGLTTLVVLLVLGVALYVAVARTLESSGVSQLDARMALITGRPPDVDDDSNPYGFRFGGPGSGTFSLILGPDGLPVGPDQRLPAGLPVTSAVTAAATTGRDVRSTDISGTPMRILTQTVRGRSGDLYTIQVVQDRTAEQRTLDVMVAVLLIGGLVVVLVASGFGFVYARRALVPIRESLTNQRTALRRQRDFAADASHELRTPLTVIRSSVDHLVRHRDEPVASVGSALEDIDAEVRHMTTMVEDLLLLARSDSGAIALERLPVDLGDVAADGASALAKPASDAGVAIEVDPQPVVVTGDQARLRQLVMILVDNAIRHSPSGGRVTVAVRAEGEGATLTVDDQGPGIRPEDLPHVFERFYRAAGAPGGGTGLGLAIAKWVVDRHGGRNPGGQPVDRRRRLQGSAPGRRQHGEGCGARGRGEVAPQPVSPHDPVVVGDRQRFVVLVTRHPAETREPHDERGRRIGVDEPQPRADDRKTSQAADGTAGPRIDDVLAALVRTGGCDGPVADLEDGRQPIRPIRMPDPDPPRPAARRLATGDDVPADVEQVVVGTGRVQQPRGLLDRPALDVPGRIEVAGTAGAPRIERTAAGRREVVAHREDVAHRRARLVLADRTAGQPTRLAVGPVRAEPPVDLAQVGEDRVDGGGRRRRRAQVEARGRPHHVLDPDRHSLAASDPGLVERGLEALRVGATRVGGAGDPVDRGALRGERLVMEHGFDDVGDLARPTA